MAGASAPTLGEFEQIVLLAILRLDEKAYGVTIRTEIFDCTSRNPAPGALYNTLDRLEDKGMVTSRFGDPTAQRGGRPKRLYQVSAQGIAAVARAQQAYRMLMKGISIPGVVHA
jgi:DNA-binding PadR family transcriptional regulator